VLYAVYEGQGEFTRLRGAGWTILAIARHTGRDRQGVSLAAGAKKTTTSATQQQIRPTESNRPTGTARAGQPRSASPMARLCWAPRRLLTSQGVNSQSALTGRSARCQCVPNNAAR
jgi:hypothetical protein